MVGLPARGKTYISKKLTRYLNWIGVPTKGEMFTGCWEKDQLQVLRKCCWTSVVLLGDIVPRGMGDVSKE